MDDAILYWNDVALEANLVSHTNGKGEQTGPTLSSRAQAIVHLAMYDAFVGVDKANAGASGLDHYLASPPVAAAASSADAAIAAAAHASLSSLFPSQKPFFDEKHLKMGLSGSTTEIMKGHDYGVKVAKQLLDIRKDDPPASDNGYAYSIGRGAHRPDPDNPAQGFHAPFYGKGSKCFASTMRHGLDAPPFADGTDPEYQAALQEVLRRGIKPELMGTSMGGPGRTPDETLRGIFWGYDGPPGIGTPPRLYNQIVRVLAKNLPNPKNVDGSVNSLAQNAELFALVNAAMGDAGILAWEQKYIHDFWRPVVGIREHDPSMGWTGVKGNPIDTITDISWLPLGAPSSNSTSMAKNFTPPFPAYPSGHATFGAASLHMTRLFYGVPELDRSSDLLFQDFEFVSDEFNGINRDNLGTVRPRHVRKFDGGLWQMIIENGLSRVDLGVHWVFDAFAVDAAEHPDLNRKIGGVHLGLDIAEDIFPGNLKEASAAAAAASIAAPTLADFTERKPWPLG